MILAQKLHTGFRLVHEGGIGGLIKHIGSMAKTRKRTIDKIGSDFRCPVPPAILLNPATYAISNAPSV